MYEKWMIYLMQLVLAALITVTLNVKATESSKDYLRKVMTELQQSKNLPLSSEIYSAGPYFAGKRLSVLKSNFRPTPIYDKSNLDSKDVLETAATDNQQYYHQFSSPIVVPETTGLHNVPVEFNKNQLAAIYQEALNSGNIMTIPGLKNGLNNEYFSGLDDNHLQIPSIPQQQMYSYQFFPLRTFLDKFRQNYGHNNFPDLSPHAISEFQGGNKQIIINPLFMAVSSFIGMALLFMFGVIFLPRIFGEFKSRVVHDEFLNLTKTVTEAIDNSTTTRPKTRFSGAVVGIKTRPVLGVSEVKRQRKTQRPS